MRGEIRSSVGARLAAEQRGQINQLAVASCSGGMHVFESRNSASCVCGERQRPALGDSEGPQASGEKD